MKKLINDVGSVVREALEGLVALHPQLALLDGELTVVRADLEAFRASGRVAILTGGGAGHEPAHAGYVGEGMLTAAVSGDVFASPSTDAVYAGLKAIATPAGVLVIVKNYTGDRLNFGLAVEMARAEGIPCELVVVDDDAALGTAEETAGRRGIAGTVLVHKVAGAAAAAGKPLAEVAEAARTAIAQVATMGVALSPCTVPAAGKPNFTLGDDEMELGLGIHGEAGVKRTTLRPAREIVATLLDTVIADRRIAPGQSVALLVNNLGATPPMEMTIVARNALANLRGRGISVARAWCGTFLSAIDMAGISLSVLAVDPDLLAALDAPTTAPAWPGQGGALPDAVTTLPVAAAEAAELTGTGPATPDGFIETLTFACRAIIAAEPTLTEMDRHVGDGDIGNSLAAGARAMIDRMDAWRGKPLDGVLLDMGLVLRKAIGGTSGPLYSAFVIAAARQLQAGPADAEAFRRGFGAGTQSIMSLGGAAPGDCTMVDALAPAAEALESATGDLAALIAVAANAARAGAEATAQMQPRRGRSSYIGDRAIGFPDPGAVAVAMWLDAVNTGRDED